MRLTSFLLFSIVALAADTNPAPSTNETAQLLTELLHIDTSNPPGNEQKLDDFLAAKFRPLGFEIDIIPTPQAGKAHFIARLRGDGSKKPILLAAHSDVVGVEREKWSVDPFAGVVKDGYVYGRGAIDFKGGLAVFAQAVMNIARNKVPLSRDIIFLSEADEEGGQYNTRWLAEKAWAKIDCEFSLNEGGWIIKDDSGKVLYVSVSTADKSGVSLALTARGTSTHSSMPRPDNAIFTLGRALARLGDYDTKVQLTPSTRQFFATLAKVSPEPQATQFRNLLSDDPKLVAAADKEISSKDFLLHAIMRNTIAPVLMSAGFRGNVIPGSAEVTINFRTIPGTDPQDLIKEIKNVIDDNRIEVTIASGRSAGMPGGAAAAAAMESYLKAMRDSKESPIDTVLYDSLARNAKAVYPTAEVTPYLFQAGTDSFAWRSKGIPVYGIYPYPITAEDLKRMHGNDERVPVDSLKTGTDMIYRTLVEVAGKK